jgi:hypothetical protein
VRTTPEEEDRDIEERLSGAALEARIRDTMGRAEAEILSIEVRVMLAMALAVVLTSTNPSPPPIQRFAQQVE